MWKGYWLMTRISRDLPCGRGTVSCGGAGYCLMTRISRGFTMWEGYYLILKEEGYNVPGLKFSVLDTDFRIREMTSTHQCVLFPLYKKFVEKNSSHLVIKIFIVRFSTEKLNEVESLFRINHDPDAH